MNPLHCSPCAHAPAVRDHLIAPVAASSAYKPLAAEYLYICSAGVSGVIGTERSRSDPTTGTNTVLPSTAIPYNTPPLMGAGSWLMRYFHRMCPSSGSSPMMSLDFWPATSTSCPRGIDTNTGGAVK